MPGIHPEHRLYSAATPGHPQADVHHQLGSRPSGSTTSKNALDIQTGFDLRHSLVWTLSIRVAIPIRLRAPHRGYEQFTIAAIAVSRLCDNLFDESPDPENEKSMKHWVSFGRWRKFQVALSARSVYRPPIRACGFHHLSVVGNEATESVCKESRRGQVNGIQRPQRHRF